jgi:hypothetical protein
MFLIDGIYNNLKSFFGTAPPQYCYGCFAMYQTHRLIQESCCCRRRRTGQVEMGPVT